MDLSRIMPSPEWMGPELRDHKRVDITLPVTLWPLVGEETELTDEGVNGLLCDLSTGGMLIRSDYALKKGGKVRIRFDLAPLLDEDKPTDAEFIISAKVRQQLAGLDGSVFFGLEFLEYKQGNRQIISQLIERVT